MDPRKERLLKDAADYELQAAQLLTRGDQWGAEYLLAFADEIHDAIERDEEAAA